MRTTLLMGLMIWGCGPTAPGPDQVKPGECLPVATSAQRCEPFDGFHQCLSTEEGELQFLCDLATVRPEVVSTFTCREGNDWRLTLPGAPQTCSYSSGKLVGASLNQAIAGYWMLHDCVAAQLCPERDAGNCLPLSSAYQPCDEDVSHFGFCKPSEAEQRAVLCAPDAGSYSRLAQTCDGGVELRDVLSGLGPTDSCIYEDGGLIGASTVSDTTSGPVHGRWALEGCVQTSLCP